MDVNGSIARHVWYSAYMFVERIYDEDLAQAAWMIGCQATGEALLIDPERDVCWYLEVVSCHHFQDNKFLAGKK